VFEPREEFAAISRLSGGAGRGGEDFIHLMGFGDSLELRQRLQCRAHRFRSERSAVEPTRAESHHGLFAVNNLE